MCGAKGEGVQCRTEDPETRGREDHGHLDRGSGGDGVGEAREEARGGQVSLPQRVSSHQDRKSTSFMKNNCHLFT